jgi:hypothetical protein
MSESVAGVLLGAALFFGFFGTVIWASSQWQDAQSAKCAAKGMETHFIRAVVYCIGADGQLFVVPQ